MLAKIKSSEVTWDVGDVGDRGCLVQPVKPFELKIKLIIITFKVVADVIYTSIT